MNRPGPGAIQPEDQEAAGVDLLRLGLDPQKGGALGSTAARPAPQLRQFTGQRRAVAVLGAKAPGSPRPEGHDALCAPVAAGDAGSGQCGGECCGTAAGGGGKSYPAGSSAGLNTALECGFPCKLLDFLLNYLTWRQP